MKRLITFGGLAVRNGSVVNGVANPRSRLAILAVMAVAGDRGIRREKLASMFWPDSDEERGRNALRQALFTLKRDIAAGDITVGTSDIRLNPVTLTSDVSEFELAIREQRFGDAAELYRGAFLDGVFLRESPEFERWVDEQRTRLSGEYSRALEKAAQSALVANDFTTRLQWLEKLSAHDPLSGRIARLYMEALVDVGDREKAIRHAAAYAASVRSELDVEPDVDVLLFAERIRASPSSSGANAHAVREPGTIGEQRPGEVEDVASRADRGFTPHWIDAPKPALGSESPMPMQVASLWRRAWIIVTAIAVLVTAFGMAIFVVSSALPVATTLRTARSVAVFALKNESTDSSMGVLVDVIRSEISNGFAESKLADVVPSALVDEFERRVSRLSMRARSKAYSVNWSFVVSGRLISHQDSLVVLVDLWESARRTAFHTVSVSVPSNAEPLVIARIVRSSVVAAMAPRLDELFAGWANSFTPPMDLGAFGRFADALRQTGPDREGLGQRLIREAIALDSGFVLASLWTLFRDGLPAQQRDSITKSLESRRGRFTELERAMLDYHLARNADRLRRFFAARRLVELAPECHWLQWVFAGEAADLARFREALMALKRIDTSGPWMARIDPAAYWAFRRNVHHAHGEYSEALHAVRRAIAYRPEMPFMRRMELGELAALGRYQSVDSLFGILDNWSRSPATGATSLEPFAFAVEEFSAHGHRVHASRLGIRLDSILALLPDSVRNRPGVVNIQARSKIALGQNDEAIAVFQRLSSALEWRSLSYASLAWAAAGNHSRADSALKMLIALSHTGPERALARGRVAQVYALLGDRIRATAALREALRDGVDWNSLVHDRPAADSLRRYPGVEELVRETR